MQQTSPLFDAVLRGDEEAVQSLLRGGAVDVNARNVYGQTPLMVAAQRGARSIAWSLLVHGAETKLRSNSGRSAFQYALASGSAETADYLRTIEQFDRKEQFAGLGKQE